VAIVACGTLIALRNWNGSCWVDGDQYGQSSMGSMNRDRSFSIHLHVRGVTYIFSQRCELVGDDAPPARGGLYPGPRSANQPQCRYLRNRLLVPPKEKTCRVRPSRAGIDSSLPT